MNLIKRIDKGPYSDKTIGITGQEHDANLEEIENAIEENNSAIQGVTNGYKGPLTTADTPTEDGIYTPTEESADYTNAGNLSYLPSTTDQGFDVTFIKSGATWTKKRVDLNLETEATPIPGSTKPVQSGGVADYVKEVSQSKVSGNANIIDVSAYVQNGGYSLAGDFVAIANYRAIVDYPIAVGKKFQILGLEDGAKNGVFKNDADDNVGSVFSVNSSTVYTAPTGATKACVTLVGGADTPGDVDYTFYLGDNDSDFEISEINGFKIKDEALAADVATNTSSIASVESTANSNSSELATFTKDYPFQFKDTVNSLMKASVKNVILIDPNPEKNYTIAVMRRNIVASGNLWDVRIYEYTNTFGAYIQWTETNYTPSADIEQIELTGAGDFKALMTIDWTSFPDETSLTSQVYATAGLMRETYHYSDPQVALNKANIESLQVPSFSEIHDIIIPSKIYLPTGRQLWMYNHSIIENYASFDEKEYNLFLEGTGVEVRTFKDYNKINADTGTVDFNFRNLKALTKSNKTLSNILTKTINVYDKTKVTGANFNTLVIADSYFDNAYGDGIYEYMKAFAVADTNTITFKGTRTSYGNLGEARGGWNALNYATNYVPVASRVGGVDASPPTQATTNSPFMFSTDDTVANKYFSFSEYLSTNSLTNIDNIIFFLGMNGGDGSYLNTMITDIKLALPNVNIIVSMIPTAELWRENFDSVVRQLDRESRNKNYLTLFDGRENEDIYVAPVSAIFNRQFSLRIAEIDTVQYPSDLLTFESWSKDIMVNDHHPQNFGAKSIAYLLYNYLLYINS